MRLMVDGVFFQLASSGIARVWRSILPKLASKPSFEVFLLDRGGAPPMPGVTIIPFPSYKDRYTADDSLLVQKTCEYYNIDIFSSTYYTTPLSIPMIMIIYDMIPELFEFDLSARHWMEKEIAISFARRYISISNNTKNDLVRFYPEIPHQSIQVAHPGYDAEVFHPYSRADVEAFRTRIGFKRPYLLLVGSREQHKGYKNGRLLFQALSQMNGVSLDVLCAGGEPEIDPASLELVPTGCRVKRLTLSDQDLALAYAGASALVYPSLYEGFGLPVLEAMATGCPVVTTKNGSLAELVEGNVCLTIDGASVSDLVEAVLAVQRPATRDRLVEAGLNRASAFGWDALVDAIARDAIDLAEDAKAGAFSSFFANWTELRLMQAGVDIERLL